MCSLLKTSAKNKRELLNVLLVSLLTSVIIITCIVLMIMTTVPVEWGIVFHLLYWILHITLFLFFGTFVESLIILTNYKKSDKKCKCKDNSSTFICRN